MTEFKPQDQPSASTSAVNIEKRRGRQKRRTKREDLNTAPTALGDGVEAGPSPENPQSALLKRWPCLVRSPIYNPDYPTFCGCFQPHCSHHCPIARGIVSRGCTNFSWPAHGITSYSDWPVSGGTYTDHDVDVEAEHQGQCL